MINCFLIGNEYNAAYTELNDTRLLNMNGRQLRMMRLGRKRQGMLLMEAAAFGKPLAKYF